MRNNLHNGKIDKNQIGYLISQTPTKILSRKCCKYIFVHSEIRWSACKLGSTSFNLRHINEVHK